MGIKYLTSFVRNVNKSIATQHVFPAVHPVEGGGTEEDKKTVLVIDAWAFIYSHFYRYIGDVTKGEFARWHDHCVRFVQLLR